MNQDFDLEAWRAHMTTCIRILEGSDSETWKLLDYPGYPLPRRTKSREGVLNRPKGTKRDWPDAAAGGEVPTATYRHKRRCVNPAGLETAEITKPQAFSPIPQEQRVKQGRIQRATSDPNPAVLNDGSSSPSTTGPSTRAADNGFLDPNLLCSKNSTSRSSPPAASQDITTAQGNEEDERELPSLDSLLGLDSTRPHSDSKDALNQRSLTKSALPIQESAEVPGPDGVLILQELSDYGFDARAPLTTNTREAQRLTAFAFKDKLIATSGHSSTSKRSNDGTGKCPECGADVHPSLKRPLKRLSARQRRAFCKAHKRKDELEAAKTEWAVCRYPVIDWQKLDARLQKFSPALRGILNGATPSFYRSELESAVARSVTRKFCCMENATAGYYGPRGQRVMMEHIIFELKSDFPRRMNEDPLLRMVGVGAYVVTVLVPELAVMLIKEDMMVEDDETARQILQRSAGLGETLHEDM